MVPKLKKNMKWLRNIKAEIQFGKLGRLLDMNVASVETTNKDATL